MLSPPISEPISFRFIGIIDCDSNLCYTSISNGLKSAYPAEPNDS